MKCYRLLILTACALLLAAFLSAASSGTKPCAAGGHGTAAAKATLPLTTVPPLPTLFILRGIAVGSAAASSTTGTVASGTVTGTWTTKPYTYTDAQGGDETVLYRKLYPYLYCDRPTQSITRSRTVYLTFDDGPSKQTPRILDILKSNGVKATFFVVGKTDAYSKSMMKRIVGEGHTIGLHSYSHNYKTVYQSVPAFLEDYNRLNTLIIDATGTKPDICRFPGGSINDFNKSDYKEIIAEIQRRGYTYYDWNVSSADTNANATADSVYQNIVGPASGYSRSIVLMHDAKPIVPAALDSIIRQLKKQGYCFDRLTNEVKPIVF